ncbi:unnamed protein product, partial [Ectocarpus fasciculatus]
AGRRRIDCVLGKTERFFPWLEPSAEVKQAGWHPSSGETQRQRGVKGIFL